MIEISNKRPILIFGSNGNLGSQLTLQLNKKYKDCIIAWTRKDCNVMELRKVEERITTLNPSIVINAVAYNNVDACEHEIDEQKRAIILNVTFVECLARTCENIGAKLIHFSTNYVFSGNKDEYIEKETTSPVNFYGLTKLMGEDEVKARLNNGLNASIIRVSNLFGPRGVSLSCKPSFFDTIYNVSKEKGSLNVIDDEYNCFTYTVDVAERVTELIENEEFNGIFHFVNNEPMSWYEAACRYFKLLNETVKINPINSSEYKRAAKRPCTAILKSTRIEPLRSFEDAMINYINSYRTNDFTR